MIKIKYHTVAVHDLEESVENHKARFGMEALADLVRRGRVRGCGVAVVDDGTPAALLDAADYRLDGVDGVEMLLERLCESL